ncbi:hypothetical protein ABFE35_001820 [Salmonella enterica]|nr:hypothetical protein [Salmonella enterica]EJO9709618.1 hypothetical protein [Salmonella enterica]EJO9736606.1 hypothetical protein [Salmonella enterica]EJO9830139.1 hypothetical protein [Salmonella enterica]EJP1046542.1 hypothetical protein [Salmonella enterica]
MLNKYYRFAVEKDDPSEAPESGDKPDSQPQKNRNLSGYSPAFLRLGKITVSFQPGCEQ